MKTVPHIYTSCFVLFKYIFNTVAFPKHGLSFKKKKSLDENKVMLYALVAQEDSFEI